MDFSRLLSVGYWVHNIDPFAIKFPESFGLPGIRWYGIAYFLGFIVGALLLHYYYKKGKSPLDSNQQTTLITALILGVLIGGRLGYALFYDLGSVLENPLRILAIWKGGMSSHGGFIGVFLAAIWFSRRNKINFLKLGDIVITLAPAGLCFGRIANFINGGLWGRITDVPWAVIFPGSAPYAPIALIQPRHPSQLYEALLEGLLLFIYTQFRFWKNKKSPAGQLSGEFLIGYGIMRIFVEFFREPDAPLILGMSRGQFYSIFIILGGIVVIAFAKKLKNKNAKHPPIR